MHTERRLTSLFDNVTDSDDSDTNDQSMHTERQLSSWNDIKLCADKPMIMQPPRTCPLNDENTDTTNEDSEVHAIIPVETKRTRKRRKRTQRAHSRQLPPAPRCLRPGDGCDLRSLGCRPDAVSRGPGCTHGCTPRAFDAGSMQPNASSRIATTRFCSLYCFYYICIMIITPLHVKNEQKKHAWA